MAVPGLVFSCLAYRIQPEPSTDFADCPLSTPNRADVGHPTRATGAPSEQGIVPCCCLLKPSAIGIVQNPDRPRLLIGLKSIHLRCALFLPLAPARRRVMGLGLPQFSVGVLEPIRSVALGPPVTFHTDEGQTAAVASAFGVVSATVNADDCFIDTKSPHTAHIVVAFPPMGTAFVLLIFMDRIP